MQALRELEEELNTKIYPGTEIMRDVGTHHFVKAEGQGHSVLVPQPSDDEHDPLVSTIEILENKIMLTEIRIGAQCGKAWP